MLGTFGKKRLCCFNSFVWTGVLAGLFFLSRFWGVAEFFTLQRGFVWFGLVRWEAAGSFGRSLNKWKDDL
jgi:hypothetical protein